MMPEKIKTVSKYFSKVKGLFTTYADVVQDWHDMGWIRESRTSGIVRAPREYKVVRAGEKASPCGIIFKDGSFLNFVERIVIDDDQKVRHVFYNYHYRRPDGYFFRYDKWEEPFPDPIKRVLDPQCHLHAVREEPRYKTHSTCLHEVVEMIATLISTGFWIGAADTDEEESLHP